MPPVWQSGSFPIGSPLENSSQLSLATGLKNPSKATRRNDEGRRLLVSPLESRQRFLDDCAPVGKRGVGRLRHDQNGLAIDVDDP